MQSLTSRDIESALQLLTDVAIEHLDNIRANSSEHEFPDSDEEKCSNFPVSDNYYDGGSSSAVITMTNFSPEKFERI